MRIFLSAGEPSGDLHGSNLVLQLRRLSPDVECVGFGGERMRSIGCRLLFPLCDLAVMWFLRVLLHAPTFVRLLLRADRYFRDHRPDAVVLIDYPGFHWWLARRARARGIPVFYFVPPQLWAWAGWRVRKVRRFVDHVLCSLPFEEAWYRERGVRAVFLGHPYFDELAGQRLDADFVAAEGGKGGTVVALLPGSRDQEIERNLDTLLRAADRVHAARPDTRFVVACLRPEQVRRVEGRLSAGGPPVTAWSGRTAEVIHLARACVAVSGSVGLELLYRGKPAVVVYRVASAWDLFLCRLLMKCRFISLVNLLAGKELFPEFLTVGCPAEAVAERLLRWLNDPSAYDELTGELDALRRKVAEPGACSRAARYILEALKPDGPESRAA